LNELIYLYLLKSVNLFQDGTASKHICHSK